MQQTDGKRYAQKTAFYLVNELMPRFTRNGITSDEFWTYIKFSHGVSSRKDLTELDWVKTFGASAYGKISLSHVHGTMRKSENA